MYWNGMKKQIVTVITIIIMMSSSLIKCVFDKIIKESRDGKWQRNEKP